MIDETYNGRSLSNRYETVIRSDDRQFRARLKLDGEEIQCAIKRLEFTKGSCGSETFTVGNLISNTLRAELAELTDNLKGERITAEIGLLTDEANDTWEYIQMGEYLIATAEKTRYSTTLTGYGRVVSDSGDQFTEPTIEKTIYRLRTQIAIGLGCTVELESGIDGSLEITEPMNGLTTYQAMQVLASAIGGYFTDLPSGDVRLCRYKTSTDTTITAGLMRELPQVEEQDFEVTGVRCIVTEASSDTEGEIPAVGYESGYPVNLVITNKYMTRELFDFAIERLVGYSYRPGVVNMALGDPRIEGTDVINVTDVDGTVYKMPCHKVTHIYDGGFQTRFEAVRATNQANDIGSEGPMQTLLFDLSSGVISAKSMAKKAETIAADTAQYFWHTETGTDTGAHITEIPQEDFLDDPAHGGGNLLARSNGIAVRDGLTELATFSADKIQVGQDSDSHTVIGTSEFRIDKGDEHWFRVYDLSQEASIVTQVIIQGNQNWFDLGVTIGRINSLQINGSPASWESISGSVVNLSDSPGDGAVAVVDWVPADIVPAMLFGPAKGKQYAGPNSFSQGTQCEASGLNSHAEGYKALARGEGSHAEGGNCEASATYSHAEGKNCTASGTAAHAEGIYSEATAYPSHAEGGGAIASGVCAHAEGEDTEATGARAHAEGWTTQAIGIASHAGGSSSVAEGAQSFVHGYKCKADADNMVVFGRLNNIGKDVASEDNYAFVIGNGKHAPRDGLVLDWSGNLTIMGTLTQSSDKRLKEHVSYLDEDAVEFIRALKPAHYIKDEASHVGFYAQDVEKADKWNCMTGEMNGYMTLGYTEIIAPLVAYCQALEKRIKELEDRKW